MHTRLIACTLLLATALPAADFRAGAATSNITPALGSSINGGFQDGTATVIHDELHARCLASMMAKPSSSSSLRTAA